MAENVAWAVDGSRIDAANLRRTLWSATHGATGVSGPSDLKVSALSTPGPAVNVRTGGAVIASTYGTAGKNESYGVNNDATTQVAIPASGGSAQTWIVIARITDPEFNTSYPDATETSINWKLDVVFGGNLSSVTDPYTMLARVRMPANTATVTADIIDDLRNIANPRTEFHQIPNALVTSESETLTSTTTAGERFPNAGGLQRLDIPSWATRVSIDVRWSSMLLPAAAATGRLWVEWGNDAGGGHFDQKTQEFSYAGEASSGAHRVPAEVADYAIIPAALRGQPQVAFATNGRKVTGTGPTMDALTGMIWQIQFLEAPDASYT